MSLDVVVAESNVGSERTVKEERRRERERVCGKGKGGFVVSYENGEGVKVMVTPHNTPLHSFLF